jgi:hypothetical protein
LSFPRRGGARFAARIDVIVRRMSPEARNEMLTPP